MTIRLHARKTAIAEVSQSEAHDFHALHHRQRSNKRITIKSLGLFHENQLIAVISFCAPRTAKMKREYSLELYRLCFKAGIRVSGGASKLISHFIKKFKPSDFFTYQDMAGDGSAVYEKSGMKLVSQARTKQYLLAPEKAIASSEWGSGEIFTIAEVSRRGPDALLGTTLGEVFREDGKRKTNPELFLEELGWHVEETPGDRVYEWIDSSSTYYAYKITASDSEKYYYGVSHFKKANATVEDCLNDGYMGSGGKKFQNWKKRHANTLIKEIVGIHPKKAAAYSQEERLVETSYKTDPLCLNSSTGGLKRLGYSAPTISIETSECSIHGSVKHRNGVCCRCMVSNRTSLEFCAIHGLSPHQGKSCYKCSTSKSFEHESCAIHGNTKFNNGKCIKCAVKTSTTYKVCDSHGKTLFRGDSCSKCHSSKKNTVKPCPIHGEESKHQGNSCYSCMAEAMTSLKECERHGITKFRGKSCQKCASEKKEVTNQARRRKIEEERLVLNGSIADSSYFDSWSKSNSEDPHLIQAKSSKIFKWLCDLDGGHEYEKSAYDRARGRNCPRCARRKRKILERDD